MAGIELATAYVSIVPSTKGLGAAISKELNGVQGQADKAGRSMGSRMSSGLGQTLGSGASKAGRSAGTEAGTEFASSAEKSMSGLKIGAVAGAFSAVTQTVLGSFSDIMTGAMDASDATDKFKQTLNFAGLDTSAIDKAAASAQEYADKTVYNLSDIQSMTAQLAANGVKDYTGLAQAAGNLNAVAGGNAETFKSVGMVMSQTAGAGKLTTENWNQLADAIPGASGKIQQALLEAGAYTGNFRDAMANGEITAEEFNDAVMKLGNEPIAKEAAQSTKTFEGMLGNLKAEIEGPLANAFNQLKPVIGAVFNGISGAVSTVLPVFVSVVSGAANAMKSFGEWVQKNQTWLMPLAASLGVLVGAFKLLAIQQGIVAAGGLIKFMQSLTAVTKIQTAAQTAMNLVMSANPLFLIVTAIAAVVAALVVFFTKTELGRKIWQGFMDFIKNAWEAIPGIAQATWGWITGFFSGLWNGIVTGAQTAWTWFTNLLTTVWQGIVLVATTIWNGLSLFFATLWQSIVLAAQMAWTLFTTFLTTLWSGIIGIGQTIWTGLASFFTMLWQNIQLIATTVWNAIKTAIVTAWNTAANTAIAIWNGLKSALEAGFNFVKNLATTVWNGIKSTVVNAANGMRDGVKSAVETLKQAIQNFVNSAKQKFDDLVGKIQQIPGKIKSAFASAGSWLVDAGTNLIRGFADGIRAASGWIVDAIKSLVPSQLHHFLPFADGGFFFANGGVREDHTAQIARGGAWRVWAEPETGGEAYIPLSKRKRKRSTEILATVAEKFGMTLQGKDGKPVTGRVGPTSPGSLTQFANGGVVTAGQLLNFARGKALNGNKASRSLEGAPYIWGGGHPNWGDCSGTAGVLAAAAIGKRGISGRYFATPSEGSVLSSWGFRRGLGSGPRLAIGFFNGGPYGGHTSSTIFFGSGGKRVNLEMGGGRGNGQIGGAAAGADHSQYTDRYWFPLKSAPKPAPAPAGTAGTASGTSTGGDAALVELDSATASKVEEAGLQTSDQPQTWSEIAGKFAKDAVAGQVEDILSVFGVPNELPPIIKAGQQLYTQQQDKSDASGKKETKAINAAADAAIAAKKANEAKKIPQVPIGKVTTGPYRLGQSFYAQEVARAAAERGMGIKAAKIAWATVMVESGDTPKMYANNVDPASLKYPHEAVGSDHDSSGLFQQRNNGAWGTIAQRMNARASASMFLNALAKVPNWKTMDEGAAAQAVQRSAFPSKYATKMGAAARVMSRFKGKLPGFKTGGLVTGGRSRIKDDVLALLQTGEMVINRAATAADPVMAALLNSGGPEAVRSMVLGELADAAGLGVSAAPGVDATSNLLDVNAPGAGGVSEQSGVTHNVTFMAANPEEMYRMYRRESSRWSGGKVGAR